MPTQSVPTVGIEFGTKMVQLPSGERIKTHIWDTSGQERFKSISQQHYKSAVGALLVYDITREKTFDSMSKVTIFRKVGLGYKGSSRIRYLDYYDRQ